LWQVSDGLRVCARPPPEAKRWMSHATCSLRRAARTFRDRALAWLNKLTRSSLAALALGSPAGLRLERSASSLASPGRTRSSKMRGGREDESGVAPRVWAAAGSLAMASATTPSAAMGVSKSDRETVLTLTADEADEQVPTNTDLTDFPERPERTEDGTLCRLRQEPFDVKDLTEECDSVSEEEESLLWKGNRCCRVFLRASGSFTTNSFWHSHRTAVADPS